MQKSELVKNVHQQRQAIIYIRQSSPQQVLNHQESLRLQYALRERAQALGWPSARIEVIDQDLGQTAKTASQRAGFKELVARVAMGEVGIIFSTEVTRLSRNCSDWFPLLDVCAYQSCLIADRDGIYDPSNVNGRLLLGLKGQISEMELHTIQLRLRAGLLNKAQRGELALRLPAGLTRTADGQVIKEPHQEVQSRITLVFDTFLRLRSASKTMRYLRQQQLKLPRRNRFGDVVWRKASHKGILDMLKNPAYAGAFAYGRTRTRRNSEGIIITKEVPMQEWHVCVQDKYPAYISWQTYQKIQQMLADNYAIYQENATRGIPRSGAAILPGIAYCGDCGHTLVVNYKDGLTYVCNYWARVHGEATCQRFPGRVVDEAVIAAFLQALSPAEIELYDQLQANHEQQAQQLNQAQQQQLKRLEYQAALAERQYNQVDPDNRLVASELERRWEAALRELQETQTTITRQREEYEAASPLSDELKAAFKEIGQRLPRIWADGTLSQTQKKALLRCLVDKVVLDKPVREQVQLRIVWRGGDHTTITLPIVVASLAEMSTAEVLTAKVLAMAKRGIPDKEIARTLTQQGFRSPRDIEQMRQRTVANIRRKGGIFRTRQRPQHIPGYLTIPQLAQQLAVPLGWFYYRINKGEILVEKDPQTDLYLFPDQPETLAAFADFRAGRRRQLIFNQK